MSCANNIYLVGLMGAGKTTVGRHLAKRMGRRFIDTDHEIEARTGVRIAVIFELEGEAGFREREAKLLVELAQEQGLVLATGGGAVLKPENRALMRKSGLVVYINVPPRVLFERVRQDRNRPLLQVPDPLAKLESLFAERDSLYREAAHAVVDAMPGGAAQLAAQVETEIGKRCEP